MASANQGWCTVVVPCYNEAGRLKTAEFAKFLAGPAGGNIRFLFVNDGSQDGTLEMLERFRKGHEAQVQVLDQQPNGGKGEAVRAGMLAALRLGESEFVGFWDADLATPLEAIGDLLREFDERPEVQMVFGSRVRLLGRDVRRKASRHYLGRLFATVVSTMLRLPVYDTQCGAKLFRATPELTEILAEPFLSRWVFDVEIIARQMRASGLDAVLVEQQIVELPLRRWDDVAGSKVHATDFVKAFVDVVRIWLRYL
jgi:glycosyltransferase involved in cell wall biosynthesis